jgi:site-specific recombinase XerD
VTETRLGPWVRRFLLEHLVGERNLARNTQQSYRDSLALLIPFIAGKVHKTVDQLEIDHLRLNTSDSFCNIWRKSAGAAYRHATNASQQSMRWRISSRNEDPNTSNGVGRFKPFRSSGPPRLR